jgi:hypothetical protein
VNFKSRIEFALSFHVPLFCEYLKIFCVKSFGFILDFNAALVEAKMIAVETPQGL